MGPCRLLKTIFAQFLGKYRVVSALFGKIERLTFTGTFDAFQHLVKSYSFKQICFPHRSEMGVLKSFLNPNHEDYRKLFKSPLYFCARELLSITQAKFLCKRLFRVLLKSFLQSEKGFCFLQQELYCSMSLCFFSQC